ncbi:hypothetical protein HG430_004170, partial [Candidatus Gracilibacteria bacterium]|nr:hypothetical protein [Candidatus Gracilibacteria bacterium]
MRKIFKLFLIIIIFSGIVNTSYSGNDLFKIWTSEEIKKEIYNIELEMSYIKSNLTYLNNKNLGHENEQTISLKMRLYDLEDSLKKWQKDLEIRLGYEKLRRNFLIC